VEIDTHVTDREAQGNPYEASEIVTLRVRTETGKRNLILKLLVTDKISQAYSILKNYTENKGVQFVLRTNFPSRSYEMSEMKNLKELGLAPSSALIMQA
jgi:hypothetical protein